MTNIFEPMKAGELKTGAWRSTSTMLSPVATSISRHWPFNVVTKTACSSFASVGVARMLKKQIFFFSLEQCDWRNFATLAKLFVFGKIKIIWKMLSLLWQIWYIQILAKYWTLVTLLWSLFQNKIISTRALSLKNKFLTTFLWLLNDCLGVGLEYDNIKKLIGGKQAWVNCIVKLFFLHYKTT